MTQDVAAVVAKLTKAQDAVLAFGYGSRCPSNVHPSVKGALTSNRYRNILRRFWINQVGGSADHGLTEFGIAVRDHLFKEAGR